MIAHEEAVTFVEQVLCLYFEKASYDAILKMLDENFLCIGLNEHELCKNINEMSVLLNLHDEHPQKYTILNQTYNSFPVDQNSRCVFGELCIARANTTIYSDLRFSSTCKKADSKLLLTHLHISYTSKSQSDVEQSLRHKTVEMQTIYDNVDFGIMKCQMDGRYKVRFLNSIALSLLGFDTNSFTGEIDISEFIPEEEMPVLIKNATRLRDSQEGISFKLRARRNDGQMIMLACYGSALKEQDSTVVALYTIRDITEDEFNREMLISTNRELTLSQKRYDIAISNMSDDFFDYIVGKNQIFNYPSIGEKYGLPGNIYGGVDQVIASGKVHPNSIESLRQLFNRIDAGEETSKETVVLINKDGKEVVNEIKITNIFDENHKPIRAVGLISDITNRITLEQEQRYLTAITSDRTLSYEANITRNVLTNVDTKWSIDVGIGRCLSYTQVIDYFAQNLVEKEYIELFKETFSCENIVNLYENGESQITAEYRRRDSIGDYKWIKNETNIIKDLISGDVKIRCYITNIDEQKRNELKAFEEQRFYEAMVSKDAIVYEVDLTNDVFIRGFERWIDRLGANYSYGTYSHMLNGFINTLIHPDDRAKFSSCFLLEPVLNGFEKGVSEILCEYRRLDDANEFRWFSCSAHLFKFPATGTIRSFSYEQDIDEEYKKKLALIYKSEHDSLTEFYNKGTTEQLISSYLKSVESKGAKHAFIIFDIDYFKEFNDNFGHVFGDAVLSQTSKKVKELFRDDDILGRIGGDEFVVFMRNIPNRQVVYDKAKSICDTVRASYSKNEKAFKVSVSVGIAFSQDGSGAYDELYSHADTALYSAKEQGRDRFVAYENGMISEGSSVNNLIVDTVFESRSFSNNISDYIFRILYESPDKITAINSVLELIGRQYNVSRTYIFEESADGTYLSNTFEWCREGIDPQIANLSHVKYSEVGDYKSCFNDEKIFILHDVSAASNHIQELLTPQAVKSMLQFAFMKNNKFAGFVGFDECTNIRYPSAAELTELRNITSILGVFILEMRMANLNEATKNIALSIVNGLDSYAYVIDKNHYELLFVNDMTKTIAPNAMVGQLCYNAFWGLDKPCEICPMAGLSEDSAKKCSLELYNPAFDVWTRATASWIDWTDGKPACLLDCVDINCYIKMK